MFKNWITYSLDKSLSSTAKVFRLMLLARFLHRPMIHILLPLFCIDFVWLQPVFPTYFIYWIATYQVKNAIHPLNNWSHKFTLYNRPVTDWTMFIELMEQKSIQRLFYNIFHQITKGMEQRHPPWQPLQFFFFRCSKFGRGNKSDEHSPDYSGGSVRIRGRSVEVL